MSELSLTQLRARWATGVWSLAAIGFGAAFFAGGGSTEFDIDRSRHIASALVVGFGFLGHWAVLLVTARKAGGDRAVDERDAHVLARAGQAALVTVLLGVYVLCIGLWTVYESAGSVPVGWTYFLAYETPILASLAYAVATIVVDGWTRGDG